MLGFGALSSRAISGAPWQLLTVSVSMAASGTFLSIGGSANAGAYIPMEAAGTFVRLTGTAIPVWTQDIGAAGAFLTIAGLAKLYLAGKPYRISQRADSYTIRKPLEAYRVKQPTISYTIRRG